MWGHVPTLDFLVAFSFPQPREAEWIPEASWRWRWHFLPELCHAGLAPWSPTMRGWLEPPGITGLSQPRGFAP